ncbi:hypothetical protein [Tunturiibacter lichenicola]|uniref:hypothetical protein n=1 Tax=Tunturiibacter lichenicola TaxID=2051959 RepID=UPI0021B46DA2|nr:hypothetical protein [Edaphobacter lichenicola]
MSPDCVESLKLGPATADENDRVFVVVSHDCDLAERDLQKEPFAEIVEAYFIDQCLDNFCHSKSTRILHLEAFRDGKPACLELHAVKKRNIDKKALEGFQPFSGVVLAPDESNSLSHWLAARYKRAAFPNAFLDRLGDKIRKALARTGARNPHSILGIFLDYDPQDEIEDDHELYELWVYVIYSSDIDKSDEVAQRCVILLRQQLEREFRDSNNAWVGIELRECEAISDKDFSIYEAKRLKFFRLDHVSLRESPPAKLPDVL